MAAKVIALTVLLTGCSSPCRLMLTYQGDLQRPIEVYRFQPGIGCIY
jgi:hypothetical protein